ncbi:MAG: GGDEF domain-containing protein [Acholeplasmatales bacterium]|nr:GGDEF domain-containing protein [Acholeplasmatales bacterium]
MNLFELSQNETFFAFFILANVVCIGIYIIILLSNLASKNLETKNVYFNCLLVLQIIYFIVSIVWAFGYFSDYSFRISIIRYSKMIYFIVGGFAAFCWFMYIEILMGARFSRTKKSRLLIGVPIIISAITTLIISIITDDVKIEKNVLVSISQMYIPFTYIVFAGVYSIIMAIITKNKTNRNRYISLAVYPFGLVAISLLQVFFLELPIFCLGTTFMIVALYIFKIQAQVSTDPLTGINNRSALTRYIGEYTKFNVTYVLMIDVDDFKSINDNFGHVEGDKALVILADALKNGTNKCKEKCFLARYGGDEFIIIASYTEDFDVDSIIKVLNEEVSNTSKMTNGYQLQVSIGASKVNENESILTVIEQADQRMYALKSQKKRNRSR